MKKANILGYVCLFILLTINILILSIKLLSLYQIIIKRIWIITFMCLNCL
uniref:Uncharacterized protein n=1 Tax=Myoviridae sp. ctNQV2 TaxID=2827683 RepID=A0A8S5RYU5_9CAUD|nr:MAG TPA: hypothetical protein [Myoviridae sp. ctNQV2]